LVLRNTNDGERGGEAGEAGEAEELVRDRAIGLVATLGTFPEQVRSAHLARALSALNAAVRRHPDDVGAWEALAEASFRLGLLARAQQAAERLLQAQPQHEYALATLGLTQKRAGRWVPAEAAFRQLAQRNPSDARYRFEWAQALIELGNLATAKQVVAAARQRFPLDAGLLLLEVRLEMDSAQTAVAESAMRTIRALRPPDLPEIEAWYAALRREATRDNGG
jgi:tetratricopeptide (TPR) repeat protein